MHSRCFSAATQDQLASSEHEKSPEPSSSAPPKKDVRGSRLDTILQETNTNVQKNGRVMTEPVKTAIDLLDPEVQGGPVQVKSTQALLALRCLGVLMVDTPAAERTQLTLRLWKLLEDNPSVELDASHYNALLRVHTDNGHNFSPTEFLAWMEEKGVAPNRVTFQNLIHKYCENGDIPGATAILEHMKSQDLPVNESVFHSLITGHGVAGDFDGAQHMMKLMEDARLLVSVDTHLCLLSGMAKGGKPVEDVIDYMEKVSAEESVNFNDYDHMRLIAEFARRGDVDGARQLIKRTPKRSGYFQEVRNFVPQLCFLGQKDLALELNCTLSIPDRNESKAGVYAQNNSRITYLHFFVALVRQEEDPDVVIDYIKKMDGIAKHHEAVAVMLEDCIRCNKTEYGAKLFQAVKSKLGRGRLVYRHFDHFLDQTAPKLHGPRLISFLEKLDAVGIVPSTVSFASNVMYNQLKNNPGKSPNGILMSVPVMENINWTFMVNTMVIALLRYDQNLVRAANFVLYEYKSAKFTQFWSTLGRVLQKDPDAESLIMIVLATMMKEKRNKERLYFAVGETLITLAALEGGPEIVKTLLAKMNEAEMGLEAECLERLKKAVEGLDDELVETSRKLFEQKSAIWTEQKMDNKFNEFYEKRIKTEKNFIDFHSLTFDSDVGSSIPALESAHQYFFRQGRWSASIIKSLVHAYVADGDYRAAARLAISLKGRFSLYSERLKEVADHLLPEEIELVVEMLMASFAMKTCRIDLRTLLNTVETLVGNGRTVKAIQLLESANKDQVLYYSGVGEQVNAVLSQITNPDDATAIQNLMSSNLGLGTRSTGVEELLQADKVAEAVDVFVKEATENKTVQAKALLMYKLIESEDMQRMQRVLDASIGVIGEEKSLFDLAGNFLFMGKFAQAKKLLMTPGLRYNKFSVERVTRELNKKPEAFEQFVAFMRPVFACDRAALYKELVSKLRDNPAKLEEAWLNMQEEGFVPSEALKEKIHGHIVKAGKTPPFSL